MSETSNLKLAPVAIQPGMCLTLPETAKPGSVARRLNLRCIYELRHEKTWFHTLSDINRAVQPQKMARGLILRI